MKFLLSNYLNPDESVDAFGQWAFGDDFKKLAGIDAFLSNWNEIHGKELKLCREGYLFVDVPKMVALWRKSKETI